MSIAARMLARRARVTLRAGTRPVRRTVSVPARDGVELLTDIWWPQTDTGRSLIIMRTPYGRPGSAPFAEILAARGYPVIVQSCRGTFGSGGEFRPLIDEIDDGADLLSWVADQGWGDRSISLVGSSYTGFTALALLSGETSRIDALSLAVTTADFKRVIHPDGVFGLETALTWLDGLRIQEWSRLRVLSTLLRRGARVRSAIAGAVDQADATVFGSPQPQFREWVQAESPSDPSWEQWDLTSLLASTPRVLQVVGAFDLFSNAQFTDYEAQLAAGVQPRLVFGPWSHAHRDLPPLFVRETLALLDGASTQNTRVLFTGDEQWREFPSWPPATLEREWALTPSSPDLRAGECDIPVDPATPPAAAGGRGLDPSFAGLSPQRDREAHPGVALFDADPPQADSLVVGRARVALAVRPADHDQDLFVRLTDVDPRGTSRNIADGYLRIPAGTASGDEWHRVTMVLSTAAHAFRAGHRPRVQVAGTGQPWHPAPTGAPTVMTVDAASVTLTLPILTVRVPA